MTYLAGKLIVEVKAGAPNNGRGESNVTPVKKMRVGTRMYPYVSAQSYRRWLRDTLMETEPASPVTRTGSGRSQQAYTAGDPIAYLDDDLFGYMRAIRGQESQRDTVFMNGTLRSVAPAWITEDFGTMTRGFAAADDPVIHTHEFYAGDMATDLLVDVAHVGVFTLGGAGHRQNLLPSQQEEARSGGIREMTFRGIPAIGLELAERRRRLAALLRAIAAVRGGAKKASHYEDRTPAFILLAPMRGGTNPFGRLVAAGARGDTLIDPDVLREEMDAWADEITGPVWIGWAPGYLGPVREKLAAACGDLLTSRRLIVDHPRTVLRGLADEVETGTYDDWFD